MFDTCGSRRCADGLLLSTKAKGVVGYTKDVDFAESAGFEIHLLMDLLNASSFKPAYQRLCNNHPVLSKRLGLRMASATWASPRSVALEAARASDLAGRHCRRRHNSRELHLAAAPDL